MSLPEISRRCIECGAAVRAGARFCPQCGKKIGDAAAAGAGEADAKRVDAADALRVESGKSVEDSKREDPLSVKESWRRWESRIGLMPESKRVEEENARAREAESVKDAGSVMSSPMPPTRPLSAPEEKPDAHRHTPPAREQIAPAVAAEMQGPQLAEPKGRRAAAVREAVRPRVEKMREASLGVLEGAAEDTGLRFLLIAIGVFLLFLLFLLLSSWFK